LNFGSLLLEAAVNQGSGAEPEYFLLFDKAHGVCGYAYQQFSAVLALARFACTACIYGVSGKGMAI
jgi:hypothetical protein